MHLNDRILNWLETVDFKGREARAEALQEMRNFGLEQVIRSTGDGALGDRRGGTGQLLNLTHAVSVPAES